MHATSRCETSKKTPKVNAWKNTPRGKRKKFKSDNFLFFRFFTVFYFFSLFFTFLTFFFTFFHFLSVSDMDSSPLSSLPLNTRFPVINEVYRNVKCDKCIAIVVYGLMFFVLFFTCYRFGMIFSLFLLVDCVDRFWFSVFLFFCCIFFARSLFQRPRKRKFNNQNDHSIG